MRGLQKTSSCTALICFAHLAQRSSSLQLSISSHALGALSPCFCCSQNTAKQLSPFLLGCAGDKDCFEGSGCRQPSPALFPAPGRSQPVSTRSPPARSQCQKVGRGCPEEVQLFLYPCKGAAATRGPHWGGCICLGSALARLFGVARAPLPWLARQSQPWLGTGPLVHHRTSLPQAGSGVHKPAPSHMPGANGQKSDLLWEKHKFFSQGMLTHD